MPLTYQHRHRLYGSGLRTIFHDQFTDSNATALQSHTAIPTPGLSGWTILNGAFTIQSNKANITSSGENSAYVNCGKSDFDAEVTFNAFSGGGGILFRGSASNNFYFIQGAYNNNFQIYYFNGSYNALITATPTISSTTSYTISLRLRGSNATGMLYHGVTGALVSTISVATITNNPASTWVGIRGDTANFTFDNLLVRG